MLTEAHVRERWADMSIYTQPPMRPRLSGLAVEYVILQVYSRDAGQRSALIGFNVGQGSQDVGFRNDVDVLFDARPSHPVRVNVKDEHGRPTTAGFLVRDDLDRIYPNISKRLAPDFFFQPQVYRHDGQSISLPGGQFTVTASRGPEYMPQTKRFSVGGASELIFELLRWIDPSQYGWYSGDHHIHSSGCSHYENPTEGVRPEDMWPQIDGEALNLASVLTWGPSYYFQKQFFSGADHPLSTPSRLMHYDLEVSGFPSSHAGHLVLLGLKDQDYPGTQAARGLADLDAADPEVGQAQGAVVGFAHSGWGLEVKSSELPNYEMPGFDGIGANEFIVDVTHPDTVDFISAGDTPYVWELNIWYHTLNAGFRTRISGENGLPVHLRRQGGPGALLREGGRPADVSQVARLGPRGRSYVSDGKTHLMDFAVNGTPAGSAESEVRLERAGTREGGGDRGRQPRRAAQRGDPAAALRREAVLGHRARAHRRVARGAGRGDRQRRARGGAEPRRRRQDPDAQLRRRDRAEQLGRRARAAVGAHQPGVRRGWRQADARLEAQRAVVPRRGQPVLDAEGGADPGFGVGGARAAYDHAREVYRQRIAESEGR